MRVLVLLALCASTALSFKPAAYRAGRARQVVVKSEDDGWGAEASDESQHAPAEGRGREGAARPVHREAPLRGRH